MAGEEEEQMQEMLQDAPLMKDHLSDSSREHFETVTGLLEDISVKETYTIGDCANPFNIALAIRGGNDAGRAV